MHQNIIFFCCCIKMESTTANNQIKEVRELFNEIRSNLSCEEINEIRNKLYRKEVAYNYYCYIIIIIIIIVYKRKRWFNR